MTWHYTLLLDECMLLWGEPERVHVYTVKESGLFCLILVTSISYFSTSLEIKAFSHDIY